MIISLGDALVRSFEPRDASLLARYANDPAITAYMHDAVPRRYSTEDAAAWIEVVRAQSPECHFSIARGDEIIGAIGLELQQDIYQHSAEINYWIAEACWGQGIATRAVGAVTDHAFHVLGLSRLYARVFDGNAASLRVLEKNAYVLEGRLAKAALKHGRLCDQLLYAKVSEAKVSEARGREPAGTH